jgi:hypothetical protein
MKVWNKEISDWAIANLGVLTLAYIGVFAFDIVDKIWWIEIQWLIFIGLVHLALYFLQTIF